MHPHPLPQLPSSTSNIDRHPPHRAALEHVPLYWAPLLPFHLSPDPSYTILLRLSSSTLTFRHQLSRNHPYVFRFPPWLPHPRGIHSIYRPLPPFFCFNLAHPNSPLSIAIYSTSSQLTITQQGPVVSASLSLRALCIHPYTSSGEADRLHPFTSPGYSPSPTQQVRFWSHKGWAHPSLHTRRTTGAGNELCTPGLFLGTV